MDNHSAHISKETKKHLETQPNKFEFVFTPKHGFLLNFIEVFLNKMARGFLREVRVSGISELIKRIELFIDESNKMPVMFCCKYKMSEILI